MSLAEEYSIKINTIAEKYPQILEEFKKNYVIYNQHPNIQEYSNIFSSIKSALSNLNKELFVLTNELEQNIEQLNNSHEEYLFDLEDLKRRNAQLKIRLAKASSTNNGADEMNDDAKEQYKYQYLQNVTLFVGNLLLIGAMYKLIKK
jgi:chromosome segregation ATPase